MTLNKNAKVLSTSAFFATLFLLSTQPALAKLELDGMFNDHMVVQSNQPLTIWGIGTPGDSVGCKIGERKGIAKVSPKGEWKMTLEPLVPGGPYELVAVSSHDKLTLRDVYAGEVWLCSGQYNMAAKVKDADKPEDLPAQVDPRIRFVQVPTRIAVTPQKDFNAEWTIVDSSMVANLPSLPFHFANKLNKELNVAVGIIVCAANGSPIEAWMSREAFSTFPEGKDVIPRIEQQYYRAARAVMGKSGSSSASPGASSATAPTGAAPAGGTTPASATPTATAPGATAATGTTTPTAAMAPGDASAQPGALKAPEMTVENVADALMGGGTPADFPAATGPITTPGAAIAATVPANETASALPGSTAAGSTAGAPAASQADSEPLIPVPTSMLVPQNPPRKRVPKDAATTSDGAAKSEGGTSSSKDQSQPAKKTDKSIAKQPEKDGDATDRDKPDQAKKSDQTKQSDPAKVDVRNAASIKVSAATSLYNGMVAPLAPYTVKGILWYQGEANFVTKRYDSYHKYFAALVRDWRKAWQPAIPTFLFVQLPALGKHELEPNSRNPVADMRAQQEQGCLVPQTYMVVALDGSEGETPGFDDTNKTLIAERMAKVALATQYNKAYSYRGPSFDSATVEGNKVRLHFRHATHGLKAKGDTLKGFAIAGDDRRLHWANATIEGESVVLAAPEVLHPTMVAYGWQANPEANLYNGDGLPAAPFKKRFEQ